MRLLWLSTGLLPWPARSYVYRRWYLRSAHWRRFRACWWRTFGRGWHCWVCGRGVGSGPADLHHLTYARLGAEWPTDVVPVHRWCHREAERLRRSALREAGR